MSVLKDISEDIRNTESDKDKRCAPNAIFKDGSCMTLTQLIKMAEAYNKKHPEHKIELNTKLETLNPDKYKIYLVDKFETRLLDVCDDQRCWLKQDFIKEIQDEVLKEDLLTKTFRPEGPNGKFTWLNTLDIDKVMSQYEDKHKDFKWLGAVPMDFDDIPSLNISNLDFNDLKKNKKTKLGIIFNLDTSNQPGSHWVAGYVDLNNKQVYYFDSYAVEPEPRVRKFMRRCAKACENCGSINGGEDNKNKNKNKNNNLDVRFNKHRHQYKNSECGVYSLTFIIKLLEGATFDDFTQSKIPDEVINKYRQIYFA